MVPIFQQWNSGGGKNTQINIYIVKILQKGPLFLKGDNCTDTVK